MGKLKDLTGQKFNHLTVKYRGENSNDGHARWWCECDCGNPELLLVIGKHLTSGNTTSCGCVQKQRAAISCKELFTKRNEYDLSGEYGIGYTASGEEFWFDLEDYDKIKDYYWHFNDGGYVVTNVSNQYHYTLSRIIMNANNNEVVDHKHGSDTLFDNRKSNLRKCTQSNNSMNRKIHSNNTSGVTGVNWHKKYQKWIARIGVQRERKIIGLFDNFDDAVKARKEAEEKYFGEYSYDNSQKI